MDHLEGFSASLQSLDTGIFTVVSQTTENDRKSLLRIQNLVRTLVPHYTYCEVGSYLGGTLVPHLLDPLCGRVVSIDKRPTSQPDARGMDFPYPENSTQTMLDILRSQVPDAALSKLHTIDADVSELTDAQLPFKIDAVLIDAEHTTSAVFRDFVGLRKYLAESFVVAFHDSNLLSEALQNIECFLRYEGIGFRSFFLPDIMFVILAGSFAEIAAGEFEQAALDREDFLKTSRKALWQAIAINVGHERSDGELVVSLRKSASGGGGPSQRENLTTLANLYGSDKGTSVAYAHKYTYLYDLLFADLRDKPIDFLEVGLAIGGPETGNFGARLPISPSIQMWLSYFSQANIYGFDITDFSHMKHPRLHVLRGDCGNAEELRGILHMWPQYDVIIDDASHASYHQQNTFKELFPALRPGGLYIIEDLNYQTPFYEQNLPTVPKTAEFFQSYFEAGQYLENVLLGRDFMDAVKQDTYSFSLFPDIAGQSQSPLLLVIKKNGVPAWTETSRIGAEQSVHAVESGSVRAELAAQHGRIAGVEAALASVREQVGHELSALQAVVGSIAEQLEPLRAEVLQATATLDTIKRGTETWLFPTLAKHSAAIARRDRLRRFLFGRVPGRRG